MKVNVNGTEQVLDGSRHTVAEVLDALGVQPQGTAVVRGGRVVRPGQYDAEVVEDGDAFEVVRMVGGG